MTPDAGRDPAWRAARNVLAVRLDNLGDVLMTSPALAAIKSSAPDMRLTLLASVPVARQQRHLVSVDATLGFRAPWMPGGSSDETDDFKLIEALRLERFDAAVVFTVATQSALPAAQLCRLAGIPLRLAHCRENPYGLLTDWVRDTDRCEAGMRHEVRRQLDLVASVGFASPADEALRFDADDADAAAMWARFVAAGGAVDQPYFVVHPGASASSRRYPAKRFGLAAARVADASGCRAVICAGADERELAEATRAAMRSASAPTTPPPLMLTDELPLGEFAALLGHAEVVLCNNSAPSHLAVAMGTPVVVLYALTNPQHTPWRAAARVLSHPVPCRDCLRSVCPHGHHACLLGVPAPAVANAALELLAGGDR